jgi:TolB protein
MQERLKLLVAVIGFVTSVVVLVGAGQGQPTDQFELVSTIAFTSTRDNPATTPQFLGAEIYLMDPADAANTRRLTENLDGDGFAALSPDGKKIIFDSTRNRGASEPLNTSDLFVMDPDGLEQRHLIRGSSATWSPDSKYIAFHASASGTGLPIRSDFGAPTTDSDIFVANVDDLLTGVSGRTNLTNNPLTIDEDPDWSPDGQRIVFSSHPVNDDPTFANTTEIYVMYADGTGLIRLTFNNEEERGPSWSPDGTRIVYICRIGGGMSDFEVCLMNADGSGQVQLTNNLVFDGTSTFSPDGQQIVFSRNIGGGQGQEIFMMNADGTDQHRITDTPGLNMWANWGELRVRSTEP